MSLSKHSFPDYAKAWKEVKMLEESGKIKSALAAVKEIQELAMIESNHPQVIKSFLFKLKYHTQLDEDGWASTLVLAEQELSNAKQPEQSIYYSIIAQLYSNYLSRHQWEINQLHQQEKRPDDFRQWAAQDFKNKIQDYYLKSLESANNELGSTSDYTAIINPGHRAEDLRQDLKSIMLIRALDYYVQSASSINAEKDIDHQWFLNTKDFLKLDLKNEEASFSYKLFDIYQAEIRRHIKADHTAEVFDLELKRLNIAQNALGSSKSYLAALESLEQDAKNHEFYPEIIHAKCQHLLNDGTRKDSKAYVKSALDKAIQSYPNSFGADLCRALLENNLLAPDLRFQVESVEIPGQDFRINVEYKNVSDLDISIAEVAPGTEYREQRKRSRERLDLSSFDFQKVQSLQLPGYQDLETHSVEIIMDGLNAGEYLIKLDGKEPHQKTTLTTWLYLRVSELAYFTLQDREDAQLVVVNRLTGKPVAGAMVELYKEQYNQDKRRNETILDHALISNTDGSVQVPLSQNFQNWTVRLKKGEDDIYFSHNRVSVRSVYPIQDQKKTAVLFTDRAIYKPGQKVYFKAIVHRSVMLQKEIVPGQALKAQLLDSDYQPLDTLELRTNAFGSAHGSFMIPKTVLPGNFSIRIIGDVPGNTSFSVENYQRPNIEASFAHVESAYSIGDTVELVLNGQTLYGTALVDAKVDYKISRQWITPYYARNVYFERCYFPWQNVEEELITGQGVMDDKGQYRIKFRIPETLTSRYGIRPWQSFVISARVTDVTGEVTEAEKTLTASTSPYMASLNGEREMDISDLEDMSINFTNADNQSVDIQRATVAVSKLDSKEGNALRRRYWKAPDQFLYAKTEFKNRLIYDPYEEEDIVLNWPKSEIYSFEAKGISELKLDLSDFIKQEGLYQVEVKDATTNETLLLDFLSVNNARLSILAPGRHQLAVVHSELSLGNNQLNLLRNENLSSTWVKASRRSASWLQNDQKVWTLAIDESDRDRLSMIVVAVKANRAHHVQKALDFVTDREIKVELVNIDPVVLPGSEQEWLVKTTDHHGNPVAAELTMTVYDKGLDQYREHNWNAAGINQMYFPNHMFFHASSFESRGAYTERSNYRHFRLDSRVYPTLKYIEDGWHYPQPRMLERFADAEAVTLEADESVTMNKAETAGVSAEKTPESAQIRRDLAELALFSADVVTDNQGEAKIQFNIKEDLTTWKVMALGHTMEAKVGMTQASLITTKDVMVKPFVPEYLFGGDKLKLSAKVVNNTNEDMALDVTLSLYNALDNTTQPWLETPSTKNVLVKAGGQQSLDWTLTVPTETDLKLLRFECVAAGASASDGEQGFIVIKSNRKAVIEPFAFFLEPGQTLSLDLDSLGFAGYDDLMTNTSFWMEMVGAPEWLVLQSLPFVDVPKNKSIDAIVQALFANAVGADILSKHPWMHEQILALDSDSPLASSDELKAVKHQLTPWQREAINEEMSIDRIKKYLDNDNTAATIKELSSLLVNRQLSNGGFSWMPEGRDSWNISVRVLEMLMRIKEQTGDYQVPGHVIEKLRMYCKDRLSDYYEELKRKGDLKKYGRPSDLILSQLFIEAQFLNDDIDAELTKVEAFFLDKARHDWLEYGLHTKSILAHTLAILDSHDALLKTMMASFGELMIDGQDRGLFWKHNDGGSWSAGYVSAHASMVKLYQKLGMEQALPGLITWLLQNKRTHRWKSDRATIDAIQALLVMKWDNNAQGLNLSIDGRDVADGTHDGPFLKETVKLHDIRPGSGTTIVIRNPNNKIAWGGMFWKYTTDRDKIESFTGREISLARDQFFKPTLGKKDMLLEKDTFLLGDRVLIKLTIETDRDMDFVFIQDDKAAGLHSGASLSGRKWKHGLSYYQAYGQDGTQFFIDHLGRGKTVIEYELNVNHKGDFSSGAGSIQCLYAPEFGGLTDGNRTLVE